MRTAFARGVPRAHIEKPGLARLSYAPPAGGFSMRRDTFLAENRF